jgi:hypothetical protein
MSTYKHKRKGSDFGNPLVATTSFVPTTPAGTLLDFTVNNVESLSLNENWESLLQKMQQIRKTLPKDDSDSDPVIQQIRQLQQQPRLLQDRIENLPYEAAGMEEQLDAQLTELEEQWRIKSEQDKARMQRLQELQAEQEALKVQFDDLDAAVHDIQNDIAKQTSRQRQSQDEYTRKIRDMVHKIPKLQQQITMYAMCTGIKWEYDNKEAWVGHVVSNRMMFVFRSYNVLCAFLTIIPSLLIGAFSTECTVQTNVPEFLFQTRRGTIRGNEGSNLVSHAGVVK